MPDEYCLVNPKRIRFTSNSTHGLVYHLFLSTSLNSQLAKHKSIRFINKQLSKLPV